MYKMHKKIHSKRCGFAMAIVLCSIVLLLVVGTGLLNLGFHSRSLGSRTCSEISARSAADAALVSAVFALNQRLGTKIDENALPYAINQKLLGASDASYSFKMVGGEDNVYTVKCVGHSGRTNRRINAILRLKGLFDNAILAAETITLATGSVVDGYDSSDPTSTDINVKVATASDGDGSIDISSGASVDGEVLTGIDGYFPVVSAPALPDMNTGLYAKGDTITIGPADNGKYTSISLEQGSGNTILEIEGDVLLHVTGDIVLGQSCELTISPGSTLTLYLEGNLLAGNSAGFTVADGTPKSFILYGIGDPQTIELKAKSSWYGCIYAPNADVTIKSAADVYGSFVCQNFENKPGSMIYYDTTLQNPSTMDVGVTFVVDYWYEE